MSTENRYLSNANDYIKSVLIYDNPDSNPEHYRLQLDKRDGSNELITLVDTRYWDRDIKLWDYAGTSYSIGLNDKNHLGDIEFHLPQSISETAPYSIAGLKYGNRLLYASPQETTCMKDCPVTINNLDSNIDQRIFEEAAQQYADILNIEIQDNQNNQTIQLLRVIEGIDGIDIRENTLTGETIGDNLTWRPKYANDMYLIYNENSYPIINIFIDMNEYANISYSTNILAIRISENSPINLTEIESAKIRIPIPVHQVKESNFVLEKGRYDYPALSLNRDFTSPIGDYSLAWGGDDRPAAASGNYSFAFGPDTVASGFSNIAFGNTARALGKNNSIAIGNQTLALGIDPNNDYHTAGYSLAMGFKSVAAGYCSTAIGQGEYTEYQLISYNSDTKGFTIQKDGQPIPNDSDPNYVKLSDWKKSNKYVIDKNSGKKAKISFLQPSGNGTTWIKFDNDVYNSSTTTIVLATNISYDNYSHILGNSNYVFGEESIAIGCDNFIEAKNSGAFGFSNYIKGDNSISIGYDCATNNKNSCSVGYKTYADGENSIAIGYYCKVTETNDENEEITGACAVGSGTTFYLNQAANSYANAFGGSNKALGENSNAFGSSNTSSNYKSNAFGHTNESNQQYANAFGYNNKSKQKYANAFGCNNTVSLPSNDSQNQYSNAFGNNNTSTGNYSSSFGHKNTTSNIYTNAFGYNNNASDENSNAFGSKNTASGKNSNSFGINNNISTENSNAFGYKNQISSSGKRSTILGLDNTALGEQSNIFGIENITYSNHSSVNLFGIGLHSKSNNQTILGRYNKEVDKNFIIGNGTSSVNRQNLLTISSEVINQKPTTIFTIGEDGYDINLYLGGDENKSNNHTFSILAHDTGSQNKYADLFGEELNTAINTLNNIHATFNNSGSNSLMNTTANFFSTLNSFVRDTAYGLSEILASTFAPGIDSVADLSPNQIEKLKPTGIIGLISRTGDAASDGGGADPKANTDGGHIWIGCKNSTEGYFHNGRLYLCTGYRGGINAFPNSTINVIIPPDYLQNENAEPTYAELFHSHHFLSIDYIATKDLNLNNMTTPGFYLIQKTNSTLNCPNITNGFYALAVIGRKQGGILQFIFGTPGYTRVRTAKNTWFTWNYGIEDGE